MGLDKLYDNLYEEYMKRNKKNHLSKNDWLNCLPLSYRQDVEEKYKKGGYNMENEKKYICVKDLQGGDFAVGRIATAEEWREIALSWAWNDDNEDLLKTLKKLKKENVVAFVYDIWQIEILEIPADTLKTINFIEKKYKQIETTQNTTTALDYIKELKIYLDITYRI